MTEEQWLATTSRAQWMMAHLREQQESLTKAGRRRLRLFACGCCRVVWEYLPDDRLRTTVLVAEKFADGLASWDELMAMRSSVEELASDAGPFGQHPTSMRVAIDMALAATAPQANTAAFEMTAHVLPLAGRVQAAEKYLSHLTRCVFGNPFRPVFIGPQFRTSTAVALATAIYEERLWERCPILADALEEAGLDDPSVLGHLRGGGPHVRGCWVVDQVLGKL